MNKKGFIVIRMQLNITLPKTETLGFKVNRGELVLVGSRPLNVVLWFYVLLIHVCKHVSAP